MTSDGHYASRCSDRLDALSGAHHFAVNDLHFTQAQNLHKHHYVVHNSGSQPIGAWSVVMGALSTKEALDLFQLLNPIKDASHKRNRQFAPPDSHCLPGTREELFAEFHLWVKQPAPTSDVNCDPEDDAGSVKSICWLYGFVGCGKSAIAQSIAEEYSRRNRLAVSFFFFRNAGDRSTIDRFAATLAHQISLTVPGAKALIEKAIIEDPGLIEPTCSLEWQLEYLAYRPLLSALEAIGADIDDPYLMLVDGLDECMDKEGISTFIDTSTEFFSRNPTMPLRLLITSRIEEHIQTHVEDRLSVIHLIDLVSKSSRADVASLMKTTFVNAQKHNRALRALGDAWPEPQDMDRLVDYCDGSFIFGSTIARFILRGAGNRDPRTPMERLPVALKINPGLDGVYIEVLSRAQHLPHFHMIISTVALVQTPISIAAMAALLGLSNYEVIRVLVVLQAILQVPGRDDVPVSLFHTSLRDFLTDESRSGVFYSAPSHHTYLTHRSIDLLFGSNPSANGECGKYAMMYWCYHLEIAARLNELFDLDSAISCARQQPVDRENLTDSIFKSRWTANRPLRFVITESDWAIMSRNVQKADATIRGQAPANDETDLDAISRFYYSSKADKSQWLLARTDGYGRSCPPIVRVASSRPCSIKDLIQGFCIMLSGVNRVSFKLYLEVLISEDTCINLEFNRTKTLVGNERERKFTPGGSRVVIWDDLSVGLHSSIGSNRNCAAE